MFGRATEWVEVVGLPAVLRFRFPAILYSIVIAPLLFAREIGAVVAGQRAFFAAAFSRHSPVLRRNIHRLEKGLTMTPRAPIFAQDYIRETVRAYRTAVSSAEADHAEVVWAGDVLEAYFSVVGRAPEIDAARSEFAPLTRPAPGLPPSTPAPKRTLPVSAVAFPELLGLCRQRKSVRWFRPVPVPRSLVEDAISAALLAPSACNRQPFQFRYLDDPTDASRTAAIAMGTSGYGHQIPALVVLLGDFSCFPSARDRHVPYIDASLAAMQFMLALETLGLSSCAINWPDIGTRERRMRNLLGLPRHLRPVMLIALGFADLEGGVPYSAKKPVDSVLVTGPLEPG
jgi:nitroreductase